MIAPAGGGPAPGFPRALDFAPGAVRALRKLPGPVAATLLDALEAYAATGVGDVRRLAGVRPPEYRLRVGEYRVRFAQLDSGTSGRVTVLWIGHRRDAY